MATAISLGPRRCHALAALSYEHMVGGASSSSRDLDEDLEVPSAHGFLVGTTVLGGENDLITLQYQEEDKKLTQTETRPHAAGEIWDVAPHPKQKLVLTCWAAPSEARGLGLVKDDIVVSNIEGGAGARSVAFETKSGGSNAASVHDDGSVRLWNLKEGELAPTLTSIFSSDEVYRGAKDLAWDPHQPGILFAAMSGPFAKAVDLRNKSEVFRIPTESRCLTVDTNPNRPHYVLTAGEDAMIRFWDSRKCDEPVQTLRDGHQHWITKARYNPFHDQLVLSSSTDGSVCLWRATSVSSAPLLDFESDDEDDIRNENRRQQQDALVKTYDENIDSVYGLAWSAVNAWVFASLSYDGKFVIHSVPSGEKYKILL